MAQLLLAVMLVLVCTGDAFSPLNNIKRKGKVPNSNPCDGQCTALGEVCELSHHGKKKCLTLEDSFQKCQEGSCNPVRLCKRTQKPGAKLECVCRSGCISHPTLEVCGSDGITYSSHCHLHRTACTQRRHISISSISQCPHIFSAVPPNVTVVLNGSELERVINRIGQGKPNMPFLRRLVTAQDRRFPDRPESVRFFTALRILTETGYINYEKLAVKGIQSIMRKNWAQLAPVRFDDNDTRDAALLDAAESLSWLPGGSLSHHIWDDIPSIWMAFPHQIELPCVVHGTEQVQWYHNDQEISNVIHPRRIFTNRSLWIGSIRPSDEGVYRCEAMTPRGLITATSIVSVKVRKDVSSYVDLEYANVAFTNLNIQHTNASVSLVNVTVQNISLVNMTNQQVSLTNTSVHHMVINESSIANLNLYNVSVESMRWSKLSSPNASLQFVNASSVWMSSVSFSNSSFYLVSFSDSWLQNNSYWNMTMINMTLNGIKMVDVSFWNVWAVNWTISNWSEKNNLYWHSLFANVLIWNISRENLTMINGTWWNTTTWNEVNTNTRWVNVSWWNVSAVNWTATNWSEFNTSYWNTTFMNFTAWNVLAINSSKWKNTLINGSTWNVTVFNSSWIDVTWWNVSLTNWTIRNWTETNVSYWHSLVSNFSAWNISSSNIIKQNFTMVNGSWWSITSWNETMINTNWITVLWRDLSAFNWVIINMTESNTMYWFTDYNNYTGHNLNLLNVTRNNYNLINSSLWNMSSINETQLNCTAEGTSYCYINYTNLDARNFTLRDSSVGYEILQTSKLFPSVPVQDVRYYEVYGYSESMVPKEFLEDDVLIEDSFVCDSQPVIVTDPYYGSGNSGDDDLENDVFDSGDSPKSTLWELSESEKRNENESPLKQTQDGQLIEYLID